jgi:murein DD-endopeptidase MepM/ murein hydrolase activator NlpD
MGKYYTIMIVPDGADSRRGFKIRQGMFKFLVSLAILAVIGIILFFVFYGKLLTRATLADKLESENERLLRYQYKVRLLEDNLHQAREIVGRLTELAGISIEFPEIPDDSTIFATLDEQGMAILSRPADNWTVPSGLPIAGFISQDFEIEDDKRYHPGIDIACAEGTPVLATAGGEVIFAAFDSTYGYMVVVQHSEVFTTIYGHNKELLVESGQMVLPGSRLALSGNTGVSTAPHLHYEIRINGEPIDPMEKKYDER